MALLGVVTKKENETLSLFESGKRSVIKITQKEQLKTVSGVVIVIKKRRAKHCDRMATRMSRKSYAICMDFFISQLKRGAKYFNEPWCQWGLFG